MSAITPNDRTTYMSNEMRIENYQQAIEAVRAAEKYFERAADRAQEQADALKDVKGSEAAAGEGWYQNDAGEYKNAAQRMRDALSMLRE